MYVKINKISGMQAGDYTLDKNMSLKEITDIIKIHCNIAFDDNYYKTTKGLINKLKKKCLMTN